MTSDDADTDTSSDDTAVVLLVDDEAELLALYSMWLGEEYTLRTALNGEEALDELDGSVDVVLLDRRMPGRSGDRILDDIKARNSDCRVAMVTAVDPDLDIIEMGFDDYVTKPVSPEEIHATVEGLLRRSAYDEELREFYALVSKKAVLEAEKPTGELERNDEYDRLERELVRVRERVESRLEDLDDDGVRAAFRDLQASE